MYRLVSGQCIIVQTYHRAYIPVGTENDIGDIIFMMITLDNRQHLQIYHMIIHFDVLVF